MKALLLFCCLVSGLSSVGQTPPLFFDNHSNFFAKQFQKTRGNFLRAMTKDTVPERWHRGLERLEIPLHRPIEGAWNAQRPESYHFSHQFLNVVEGQWQEAAIIDQKNGWLSLAAWQGFPLEWVSEAEDAAFPVAYFDSIVQQLFIIQEHQQRIQDDYGKQLQMQVCRDRTELSMLQRYPERLGLLLSIGGGHNLGGYAYIQRQETHRPEYKAQLLENIAILKGQQAFNYHGEERYLPYSIASIQLASYFDNGLCGNSRPVNRKLEKYIGEPLTRDYGMSPLGKEVVRALLDQREGYRILIDVSDMSLSARKWYYDYLKQLSHTGPKVPILWSQASLSGKSWRETAYLEGTQSEDVFYHHPSQLSREDVNAIFESKGLIGLSLRSEPLLAKTRFKEVYAAAKGEKQEEREVLVKAMALQICRIIHILQDKEAWNHISLSTGFDGQQSPFPALQNIEDITAFAKSLEAFFENPTDILDIYTAAQIKQFMYEQSPKLLVKKLLYDNAELFWQKALLSDFRDKSGSNHWRAGR